MEAITDCQLYNVLICWASEISLCLTEQTSNGDPWMTEKAASPSLYQGNDTSNDIQLWWWWWWWFSNPVSTVQAMNQKTRMSGYMIGERVVGVRAACYPLHQNPRQRAPSTAEARAALLTEKQTHGCSDQLLCSVPTTNTNNPVFNCLYFIWLSAWKIYLMLGL